MKIIKRILDIYNTPFAIVFALTMAIYSIGRYGLVDGTDNLRKIKDNISDMDKMLSWQILFNFLSTIISSLFYYWVVFKS